jgi:SAM-dependent methyltransferase
MTTDLPEYYSNKDERLAALRAQSERSAQMIFEITKNYLHVPPESADVLEIGSGFGLTTIALSKYYQSTVGIEPSTDLYNHAVALKGQMINVEFRNYGVYEHSEPHRYDLAVLDNVLEHLENHERALDIIFETLRPSGLLFILVPNKLWPIEVHYHLPFLSYLPLPVADFYLRMTGKGTSYYDASFAPTYFSIKRLFRKHNWSYVDFVLPASIELATLGNSFHYRIGVSLLKKYKFLWVFSKAFIVVAVKGHD